MEFTLLAAALTGLATAWLSLRLEPGASVSSGFDSLLGAGLIGVFSGRVAAMIESGISPLTRPGDILAIRGGVHSAVAAITAIGFLAWTHRHDIPRSLDALAPAIVAGMAGWHGGCVWRGACLGARADVPWGWARPGSEVVRHPVELYTAALLLLSTWLVLRLARRGRPWTAAGAGLAAVAGARLITEPLRLTLGSTPGWLLAAGVVAGIGTGIAGFVTERRSG